EKSKPAAAQEPRNNNVRGLQDLSKAAPLPNDWLHSGPRYEAKDITRGEYNHITARADVAFQDGGLFVRNKITRQMRFLCNADDPNRGELLQNALDRDITTHMNGAREPTRQGLEKEDYGTGACLETLLEWVNGNDTPYSYCPYDASDLLRCLIGLERH